MTKIIGWDTPLDDTSEQFFIGSGLALVDRDELIPSETATPGKARFIVRSYNLDETRIRIVAYNANTDALVAFSDFVEKSEVTLDDVTEVPVTALADFEQGQEYYLGLETADGNQFDSIRLARASESTQGNRRYVQGDDYTFSESSPPDPVPSDSTTFQSSDNTPVLYFVSDSATPGIRFSTADNTDLVDRDGNPITESNVPIQVSDQRDPRGATALTNAPTTMDIVDGEATLDLSDLDPQPEDGDWLFVTVYDEGATVPEDVARRYPLQFSEDV